jgi:ubiquinone/menaquinone biosynthesis C-methylase UbiE
MKRLSEIEINEKEYFNKLARKYDENYHYQEPFTKYKFAKKSTEFERLVNSRSITGKLKMLEIGCGTGEYTKRVARLFPEAQITGLDISEQVVSLARKKCKNLKNISFVVKSAYNTNFPKESFDIIFGFYVLHHLKTSKLRREILRILKPGQLVFFYEPNIINPVVYMVKSNKYLKNKVGDSPHEWGINPFTIRKQLRGFRILSIVTSEFVFPWNKIPLNVLIAIDKISGYFKYVPLLKYLGGSVYIFAIKK